MHSHLDKDILTNKYHYFFCLLGPRFDPVIDMMAQSLKKKFSDTYKPIYVFSAHPNKYFLKDNYIVLNKGAEKIEENLDNKVVYLQEYEDLNIEFTKSAFIKDLGSKLLAKQHKNYIYAFTSAFLKPVNSKWIVLGPTQKTAQEFDDKTKQHELFEKLDLPRNTARIFSNRRELLKNISTLLPCYITASFTSGGNESGLLFNKEMLLSFFSRLRKVNKEGRFVVSNIFERIAAAPNVSALVTDKNTTQVLIISDQILRGTRYLGNVYPSSVSEDHRKEIQEVTQKIGNYLSEKGFRGFFGCDFLINQDGRLVVIDLNPRRQGGYACNALALEAVGISLTDVELECALNGKSNVELPYKKIQYDGAWAHSKIKPYDSGQRIDKEIKRNSMTKIFRNGGGSYVGTFYQKDSIFIDGYLGYTVSVGKDREQLHKDVLATADNILHEVLA